MRVTRNHATRPATTTITIFVIAGFFLGENWHVVEEYAGVFQKIVIVVVAGLVAWFLVTRIRSIRRDRAAA